MKKIPVYRLLYVVAETLVWSESEAVAFPSVNHDLTYLVLHVHPATEILVSTHRV